MNDASAPPPPVDVESRFKSKGGLRRIWNALTYSRQGLQAAIEHEAAFRQELVLVAILAPVAIWLPFSGLERVVLIGSLLLMLVVELINSAIEAVADRVSLDAHPLAGRAKDLGSAAVLLTILMVLVTWLTIALPVLIGMFRR